MQREITSLQHPLVKHLVRLRQNRDYREEHQSIVIAGNKPVKEICLTHRIKTLVTDDANLIPQGVDIADILLVNDSIMKKISGMQSNEGLVAEIAMPKASSLEGKRFILACDGVSDPGNLGTLLRTALALGWEGAFILNHSCDPFNEKALRAARGATLRLPLCWGSWDDLAQLIQRNGMHPFVATLEGTPLAQITPKGSALLVLSNEAHGPSNAAHALCEKVKIPMPGEMESLNVAIAGGILLYALSRPS